MRIALPAAVTMAAMSSIAASDSDSKYKYTPPNRPATALEAAAEAATQPRVQCATKPTPRVLFVLGGPGAGKGTQCSKLVKEYGFVHLSAGDLLREERASGSADAEMIESFIREGKIVPVEVTVKLLKKAMDKSGASKFLIDGFPRNFNNLEGWQSVMKDEAIVDGVLLFDVEEDVMVERLLERGKTSGRSDDNPESIRKRLRTYVDSTVPVLEYYAKQGKVSRIYGGDPVNAVFKASRAAVEPTVQAEVLSYNALLLDAIASGDWAAYTSLVSPDVTCFEPEAEASEGVRLISGLEFHQRAFQGGAAARRANVLAGKGPGWTVSTMQGAQAKLLGPRHALVTYTRVVSPLEAAYSAGASAAAAHGHGHGSSAAASATVVPGTAVVAETRVWEEQPAGGWRCVHFHRGTPRALSLH